MQEAYNLKRPNGNIQLLPTSKEDKDYKVIPHDAWKLLNLRYGMGHLEEDNKVEVPNDIVRLSVEVPTADEKKDFIVELNLRRFKIRTFPNIKYNKGIQT